MRNYQKMTGHPGTVLDLFSLEQYRAWNDNDPPPGWKEATPLDIWMAFGRETPDVLFLSAPCKGFSGLLASIHAATDKYQALNRSEEHTSELQSLMRTSYAVVCLKKKTHT